jgi:hypothetical protein
MTTKLSEQLQRILGKKYEPSSRFDIEFKGNDVTFKTDNEGNAILLFIGKRNSNGVIKGQRYARTLKADQEGRIIKDHWELKGKAT